MKRSLAAALLLVASTASAARAPVPDPLVELRVESAEVKGPGNALHATIAATIAEGWHVQSHEPSEPGLIATTLTVEPPADWKVGEVAYPAAKEETFGFTDRPLAVYDGVARFVVPLTAPAGFDGREVGFRARLRYQACDDERCLRPTEAARDFVVRVAGGAASVAVPSAGDAAPAAPTNAAPVERWLRELGILPTLALIVGLGLALNLTPCVYPLISVTLAYFGGQSGERRLLLAIVYALGIAVTFSILGVSAALSGGLFGSAFQRPEMLIAIALVMVVLALSSFGLYTLQPPAWLLQKVGGSGAGAAGAFSMGLTMGVVAAPCIGPIVVGLLVAVAERADPFFGFVLFFALAIGLGAPYVVLAVAAGSLARLPRSGAWQIWVERLFGCVLLGLALYYVSPLLPKKIGDVVMPVWIGIAGVYLGFLDPSGRGKRGFVALRAVAGLGALAFATWHLLPEGGEGPRISWQPFSPASLERAAADGLPAVIDFRADWCLPCVEMERTTYVEPDVVARSGRVAMLQADVTEMTPDTEELLQKYEILGVPTTIFVDRDGREVRREVGYIGAEDFVRYLDELAPAKAG